MTNYSNPRMHAEIPNWPSGAKRVTAWFDIEVNYRGERAVRVTTGASVKLTYAKRMRIVDGDDGRTYIARAHGHGMVSIMRGDMKTGHEVAHHPSPRYHELMELFAASEPMVNLKVIGPEGEAICNDIVSVLTEWARLPTGE